MREVLFEDHDVLMLFNPALDGIEDDADGNSSLHPRGLVSAVPSSGDCRLRHNRVNRGAVHSLSRCDRIPKDLAAT